MSSAGADGVRWSRPLPVKPAFILPIKAFGFIHAVFIKSVSAIDFMWAMAFILKEQFFFFLYIINHFCPFKPKRGISGSY